MNYVLYIWKTVAALVVLTTRNSVWDIDNARVFDELVVFFVALYIRLERQLHTQ